MAIFKGKNGFTLIETLISTAIMVSVLGALVYGLSQSAHLSESAKNQDIAFNAAQEKIEEIANDLSSITNYDKQTFPITDTQGNDLLENSGGAAPGQITVKQVGTSRLYDVVITVTWQQRGGRQISRSLSTTLVQK